MNPRRLILAIVFLAISTISLCAAPADSDARDAPKGYVIQPKDEISVHVFVDYVLQSNLGVSDAMVTADAGIRLGGIAESIQLVGQPLSDAAEVIRKRYEKTGLTSLRVMVWIRKDGKLIMSTSPRPRDSRIAAE